MNTKYYQLDFIRLSPKDSFKVDSNLKLMYVMKGSVSLSFMRTSHVLSAHQMEIINCNEPFKLVSMKEESIIAMLSISESLLDLYYPDIKNRVYNCNVSDFYEGGATSENILKLNNRFITLIKNILSENNHLLPEILSLLGFIMNNFDDISNLLKKSDSELKSDRYYHIISYIRLHLTEHIMLNDIEKEIFISKEYISREFKRLFNRTFKEIQAYYRVIRATGLLINTKDSIETICFKSGFSSKRYFYKYFDQYYQSTPYKFRQDVSKYNDASSYLSSKEVTELMKNITINEGDTCEFKRYIKLHAFQEINEPYQNTGDCVYKITGEELKVHSIDTILEDMMRLEKTLQQNFKSIEIINSTNYQQIAALKKALTNIGLELEIILIETV